MQLTLFYIVILTIIFVVDVTQRRILDVLALPATLVALAASYGLGPTEFAAALGGAILGFIFFYALYYFGGRFYGAGALGFGDVKLAMLLGAILGIQQVLLALALGMVLAGLAGLVLFWTRRLGRRSTLPYGAFLALAGIMALIWTDFWPS